MPLTPQERARVASRFVQHIAETADTAVRLLDVGSDEIVYQLVTERKLHVQRWSDLPVAYCHRAACEV